MEDRVSDTDKIVAAILTATYALRDPGTANPQDFVRRYHEVLEELQKSQPGFGDKREPAIASRKAAQT
jgi:hypothetical protein